MKETSIGGQAIIEGVMMLNKDKLGIAVRKPNRKILVKTEIINNSKFVKAFSKTPFIRGIINLFNMMFIGTKALIFSANETMEEHDDKITTKEIVLTLIVSMLFSLGLFYILPVFLTSITKTEGVLFNIIDGLFRIFIVVGYIFIISLLKDIKRIFEYHGAEHKVINCYEADKKLTVKNIQSCTRFNARCGTSFIFYILLISIITFSLIPTQSIVQKLLLRLLLIPFIASVSYEILKFANKHKNFILFKMLIVPGLMLQRVTTKEPNAKQIEVAKKAFESVL